MYIHNHAAFAGGLWIPKEWLEEMAMIYGIKKKEGRIPDYYAGKRDLINELLFIYEEGEKQSGKPVNVICKEADYDRQPY